jgi:CrcB protein
LGGLILAAFFWVGVGGFLGANARYWIQSWAAARWGAHFPFGTMIANVLGSFLLAFFMTLITDYFNIKDEYRLLVATGFLGGFTTFSSFGYETWRLFELEGFWQAGINLMGNLILGGIGVILGLILARWVTA